MSLVTKVCCVPMAFKTHKCFSHTFSASYSNHPPVPSPTFYTHTKHQGGLHGVHNLDNNKKPLLILTNTLQTLHSTSFSKLHTHTRARACAHIHIHTHTHTHTHARNHSHTCTQSLTHGRTHAHPPHTCTHTHTHTHLSLIHI